MIRRVNPRPTLWHSFYSFRKKIHDISPHPYNQMFFYCNHMATKRSDRNQINIRLDDESMALLDAQLAYEEAQLKFKLGDQYELIVGNGLSRVQVAKTVLVKALKELNLSYEQQTTEDEEVSPYDGSC